MTTLPPSPEPAAPTHSAPPPALPLCVTDLAFWYPGRHLWAGWSHRFEPGLTWVQGPNGSGKSTLLRLLAGAIPAKAGQLHIGAAEVSAQPEAYRRQVFWHSPDPVAFDHLLPGEYFAFIASLYPDFDLEGCAELAEALGLGPFMTRRLDQLSTGSGRKVSLVAALCANTPVVLLDEPLAALDARSVRLVREVLADAAQDRDQTWIVTSHEDLGEAGTLAQPLHLPQPPEHNSHTG